MPSICTHCKEEAFDTDEQVCKACGVVGDVTSYTTEYNFAHKFVPFKKNESKKSKPNALDHGIETVDYLCHNFNISGDIKIETISLLRNVHAHQRKVGKSFRLKLKEDVGVLAGCCLLNIQKKNKCPIPILSLCSALKCHKKKLIKMTKVLSRYLVDQSAMEDASISNCTDSVNNSVEEVDTLQFLDSYVANLLSSAEKKIKEELIRKTIALVRLADSCWLLSGRSRIGVVAASAYLCWRSIHPNQKLPLSQFCSKFYLNAAKAKMRISEMKSMLLKLGENIPSVTKNYVTEKNVLFHLDYILKNSESLRNDLLTNQLTADEIDMKEYELFRSRFTKSRPVSHSESALIDEINASDVEISDTEISSYIRTDEQIKLIQSLRDSSKSQNL